MNKSGKLSLAVIFDGASSEHEVSRMSATSILENLSAENMTCIWLESRKKANGAFTPAT